MNLIPLQVKLLNREYKENSAELKSIVESEKARLEGAIMRAEDGETYDAQSHMTVSNLKLRNKEIIRILDSASIITAYNQEQVSAGATFKVQFLDEEDEEEVFTLIEEKVSTEGSRDGFITLNSEFGAAVHRKKENETFAYHTQSDYLVTGIITKIYTKEEQNEYFKTKSL